ncbi:MAG TPA: hypothetical protein PLL58_03035 [Candidatus Syntrophosphaera sp.]|jgi:hypothetical protein|nr:hypothetical protein [Candidatus Cloacimonadota bacterium]OQB91152.1 MAG: hypothetical protein BWX83_00651 [Candidatus Cloacimonetes bacterium ADurb.Bin117]HOR02884.1 hypothetical protein [Candidatus Syntrophosphaera sp.]HOU72795.1 hypothetical protein [Candidatus Syntrophosphaera sp.]HPB43214.1 hypothetical protein [Candidatus Syntrophosphaera sp.]
MIAKYEHLETMTPAEKFSAVANLKEKLEENFVSLGQLLSEIKRSKIFRMKGYESFKDFVEAEYSLSGSLAGKLAAVFDVFIDEMDVDEGTIREIGFDRLQMIQPLVRKADWALRDEWVQKAEEMPTKDLRNHIKELKKEEKEKEIDPKKVFIDQYLERMTGILNCSRTELNYKLALFFQDADPEHVKNVVRERQRSFENELNKEESP